MDEIKKRPAPPANTRTTRAQEIEDALSALVRMGEFAIAETDADQRYCEVPKDAIRAGRRALNMKVMP